MLDAFLINHGLFFVAGGAFVLLAQGIGKLRGNDPRLLDAFFYRLGFFFSLALLLVGTYVTLGPGGWVYADFQHYSTKVFCFPINWSARLYPVQFDLRYFDYSNGNITYKEPQNTTAKEVAEWLSKLDQRVPVEPTRQ